MNAPRHSTYLQTIGSQSIELSHLLLKRHIARLTTSRDQIEYHQIRHNQGTQKLAGSTLDDRAGCLLLYVSTCVVFVLRGEARSAVATLSYQT